MSNSTVPVCNDCCLIKYLLHATSGRVLIRLPSQGASDTDANRDRVTDERLPAQWPDNFEDIE